MDNFKMCDFIIVIQAADLDSDGVISQDDFRYMLDMHRVKDIPGR
jgi:hypothetical protein